jgi:hypothetical protein
MNEVAGYVESPAEKPEDQENRKNRPKHRITFATGEWHFMRVVLWTGSCPQAAGFGEEIGEQLEQKRDRPQARSSRR